MKITNLQSTEHGFHFYNFANEKKIQFRFLFSHFMVKKKSKSKNKVINHIFS